MNTTITLTRIGPNRTSVDGRMNRLSVDNDKPRTAIDMPTSELYLLGGRSAAVQSQIIRWSVRCRASIKIMEKLLAVAVLLLSTVAVGTEALRCLSCDSTTDSSCGYSHNVTLSVPVVECPEGVGQCLIANIDTESNHIVRGCLTEGSTICRDFGCFLCPDDLCNDMQYVEETCISCVTDPLTSLCEWPEADKLESFVCPDTTESRSGCFLQIKDNVYTRDCVANLSDDEFENCQSGDGDCKICKGNNCNIKGI